MMTVVLVLIAVAAIGIAGEFVRAQCRRMLERPVTGTAPFTSTAGVTAQPSAAAATAGSSGSA